MDLFYAESLISPLVAGAPIARDWHLKQIELDRDGKHITYHIGRPDLKIRVNPRSDDEPCYKQTANLNVSLITEEHVTLSKAQEALLTHFVRLLGRNDKQAIPAAREWSESPAPRLNTQQPVNARSILYLVPGHIGNPRDITLRALDILNEVKTIFVEVPEYLERNLTIWGIDPATKNIVICDDSDGAAAEVEALFHKLVALGENTCFFGCEEGIPGFLDPGRTIIEIAERLAGDVSIQTVSAGSALSTSMMRVLHTFHTLDCQFHFIGLLESRESTHELFGRLRSYAGKDNSPCCFFAMSTSLKRDWAHFVDATQDLRGEVFLTANLTLHDEYSLRIPISELGEFEPSTLDDDDKLVVWVSA